MISSHKFCKNLIVVLDKDFAKHYKLNNTNKNIVFISSILEFMIYSYLRVICMTQIIIDNLTLITSSPLSILLLIYYMSIDWSYTLFNKLLEEAKNI